MNVSFGWFARHELRLAWRDAVAMLQGGRRRRGVWAAVGVTVFVAILHLIAYAVLAPIEAQLRHPDKPFLVALTGSALLAWLLLLSQAMETVTRSFYARADLDLILASPTPAARLFAIRIAANALTSAAMAAVLIGPAVDVAAVLAGPRLLSAYGVVAAMGVSAAAAAVALTALMFRVVGPKRTRLVAQIAAAIVGAGFVVGIQIAAVASAGSLSRSAVLTSPALVAAAPGLMSPVWWPARAALGNLGALVALLAGSFVLLVASIAATAPAFANDALTVAGLSDARTGRSKARAFRRRSLTQSLRVKEWLLLWRDPWLVSQSLMQILYLLPPAVLLWRDFGTGGERLVVLAPILVMAAGQLAGGLAWLAISGEDAPDLVATAPITTRGLLRAKVEAVLVAVALPVLPLAAALALAAPRVAAVTLAGSAVAAAGACAVQFFFRAQASRASFRRRHTSSRLATFAEAFYSIAIAGAAGLAAANYLAEALVPLAVAAIVLVVARALGRPAPEAALA